MYLEDTLPAVKIMSKNRPNSGNNTSNVPRRKKGSSSADEQTALVKQLCKTYTHSVSKLVYAFAALQEQTADDSHDTVSAALAKSSRADAIEAISTALAGGVAKVIRCEDLSLRTGVLRDLPALRAARAVGGRRLRRADLVRAGVAAAEAEAEEGGRDPPAADAAAKAAAAVVAPAPAAVGVAAAAAGFARAAARPASAVAISSAAADGDDASSRPASALPKVSAFHQRQMMWQSKKLIKIAEKKVDKENKEREVTLPPMRKKMLGQYAHVESVLKRERVKAEDTRVNAAERRADEEAEARMAAERVAKEAVKEKQRIQEVCDLAETLRMTAEARVGGALAHARGRSKCAPRNSARNSAQLRNSVSRHHLLRYENVLGKTRLAQLHSEELEIRDAFGDQKLEKWPMMPTKKVLRVTASEVFDGRVSQEFRVKDTDESSKGVSLLMGRSATTQTSEVQCILFDHNLSDLEAARWWDANRHRFEKAQRAFVRSQTSQGLQVSPRNPFPAAANRQPLAAK